MKCDRCGAERDLTVTEPGGPKLCGQCRADVVRYRRAVSQGVPARRWIYR